MGQHDDITIVKHNISVGHVAHTLPTSPDPAWRNMGQSSLNHTTQSVDNEEEHRRPTTDRRWLKKWLCLSLLIRDVLPQFVTPQIISNLANL